MARHLENENEQKLLGLCQYYVKNGPDQMKLAEFYGNMVKENMTHKYKMNAMAGWLQDIFMNMPED